MASRTLFSLRDISAHTLSMIRVDHRRRSLLTLNSESNHIVASNHRPMSTWGTTIFYAISVLIGIIRQPFCNGLFCRTRLAIVALLDRSLKSLRIQFERSSRECPFQSASFREQYRQSLDPFVRLLRRDICDHMSASTCEFDHIYRVDVLGHDEKFIFRFLDVCLSLMLAFVGANSQRCRCGNPGDLQMLLTYLLGRKVVSLCQSYEYYPSTLSPWTKALNPSMA
jgi:hypothetical protein